MSQVRAAPAASGVIPVTREQRTGRQDNGFHALFENLRHASRQERQAGGRSGERNRLEVGDTHRRAEELQTRRAESGRRSSTDAADRGAPGRVERLREAAHEAPPDRARSAEESDADAKTVDAQHEAEEDVPSAEQEAAGEDGRTTEDSQDEPDRRPERKNVQAFVMHGFTVEITKPDPGGNTGGVTVSGAAVTRVDADAQSAAGMALPPGAQGALTGSWGGTTMTGSALPGPWGLAAASAVRSAAQAAEATDEAHHQSPAGGGTESKAATVETPFSSALAQAGRGRHTAGALKEAGATAQTAHHAEASVKLNSAHGPEDIARVVRSKVGARHSTMMIQLDPPELGRIRVDLRMHDQILTLRFQAETEAGHDALQSRLHELTNALESQGVRLDRVEVQHRPPPPDGQHEAQWYAQHGGQEWRQPHFGGEGGYPGAPGDEAVYNDPFGSGGPAAPSESEMVTHAVTASGVDVVV